MKVKSTRNNRSFALIRKKDNYILVKKPTYYMPEGKFVSFEEFQNNNMKPVLYGDFKSQHWNSIEYKYIRVVVSYEFDSEAELIIKH